ncbi:hypothetical protein GCM10011362_06030 [Marinobacter halophilus]|nr:hypothetical protein GCM10011362_06030 [Marinobacter halophilus]
MRGGAERTGTYSQRVLEGAMTAGLAPQFVFGFWLAKRIVDLTQLLNKNPLYTPIGGAHFHPYPPII